MIKKGIAFLLLAVFFLSACKKENKVETEIAKIPVEIDVDRFEQEFYKSPIGQLQSIKRKYPYLFPVQYKDSFWLQRKKDTLQLELVAQVDETFGGLGQEKENIRALFQHIKYYFPSFDPPHVITLTSDVDYENKVIYADSLLLISLDTYLGESNYLYEGLSQYKRANMRKSMLLSDIANAITGRKVRQPQNRIFLYQMIYHGKILYLKDKLLPLLPDKDKIGYSQEQLQWAAENEQFIWRYFVENDMLYETDPKLLQRFIYDAPFSKFYLEIDSESPGRLGQWLGWQIVRSFMNNNDVSLQQLLETPEEEIFNRAKYKPKK
ncbi:gliding motility lipoprotein GldB [Sungkyunkwania multivorans]|uniref:Gliding motility lipoprotein GldB n=1 Tax=Sungkyunkwania multivorans TaxID=1173618 RepID=A0ABW3D205_9FLAO